MTAQPPDDRGLATDGIAPSGVSAAWEGIDLYSEAVPSQVSVPEPPHLPDALDEVDQGIIQLLQADGRMALRQIARELNVSEGTIRFRLRRMEESGAVSIVAVADPFRMGYNVMSFCLMKIHPNQHDQVVKALISWPETTYVSTCTGSADIYAQLVCHDHDHLADILYNRIPEIGGVTSTETFMELQMHKVAYEYPSKMASTEPRVPPVRSGRRRSQRPDSS